MKVHLILQLILLFLIFGITAAAPAVQPNVVLIVADDLGWADWRKSVNAGIPEANPKTR